MSIINKIIQNKVVGIFRENETLIEKTLTSAYTGGLRTMELTYTIPNVAKWIEYSKINFTQAVVGAGTVMSKEKAQDAIKAGADFIVSPIFSSDVNTVCKDNNIAYIPGVMTFQEMFDAYSNGCTHLKLFPANNFSIGYLRTCLSLFPQYSIMPTGGVDSKNIMDWLNAGAFAGGIGSEINKFATAKQFEQIKSMFETLSIGVKHG